MKQLLQFSSIDTFEKVMSDFRKGILRNDLGNIIKDRNEALNKAMEKSENERINY
jgi:hypothetical protein